MRTETQTVRIGEWLGPVDWSFDFAAFTDRHLNGGDSTKAIAMLREIEDGLHRGERWGIWEHGTMREVISVGMYDGWPFWTPRPCYLAKTPIGGDKSEWYGPTAAEQLSDGSVLSREEKQ